MSVSATYPFMGPKAWHRTIVAIVAIVPFLFTGLALWFLWGQHVSWLDLGLLIGFQVMTVMGISLGYHRMLTHGAFQAKAPVRFALLFAAIQSLQGGPATWAATHRRHHALADREGDPHSPLEGLWHSHFGWLWKGNLVSRGRAYDKLMQDPIVRFFERTQLLWFGLTFVIPGFIALAITGSWAAFGSGVLWGGAVRVFLVHHVTWSVNSVCHAFGTRPYKSPDLARNNAMFGLLSFGESWHNNHHAFPSSAYLGHRWYQFDPGRYVLAVLRRLRLVDRVVIPNREERRARSKKEAA
jgi:stearoyl-CoA desaturase (Delta-9 desaturase)